MIIMEIENFNRKGKLQTEVLSFQWGIGRMPSRPSQGQGIYLPSDEVHVTRYLDDNSAEFFNRAVSGDPFPKVTIKLYKSDGGSGVTPYLEITLSDVYVSGYNVGAGGDKPTEALTLNFKEATFKHP